MKTAHTPGPWTANQYGYVHANGVDAPKVFGSTTVNIMVAVVASDEDAKAGACQAAPVDEREANARLIAAAPELLAQRNELWEVLMDCLVHGITHAVGCSHREETCSCHRARAIKALAMAGGEP